jgi:hypothetical protein
LDELFFHELQLPARVKAATIIDENGDYTIIVNEDLSPSAKREAIMHEMIHIKHDHFYDNDAPVGLEERDARDNSISAKKYLHNLRIK